MRTQLGPGSRLCPGVFDLSLLEASPPLSTCQVRGACWMPCAFYF